MLTKYALWGIGISIFAAILSFIVIKENRRVFKQKKDLRELPKIFDFDSEKKKK